MLYLMLILVLGLGCVVLIFVCLICLVEFVDWLIVVGVIGMSV